MFCAEDLRRADSIGFGWHPAPVAAEAVKRVLHYGHRMEFHTARPGHFVGLQVLAEFIAEMRFPERDVAAPANSAIADIGAAEVCNPHAIVRERILCRSEERR